MQPPGLRVRRGVDPRKVNVAHEVPGASYLAGERDMVRLAHFNRNLSPTEPDGKGTPYAPRCSAMDSTAISRRPQDSKPHEHRHHRATVTAEQGS